jgi:magnesium transporter
MSNHTLPQKTEKLLHNHSTDELKTFLEHRNFHQVAHIINKLHKDKVSVFRTLSPTIQAKVFIALSAFSKKSILPSLTTDELIAFLNFADEDDATDVIGFLPPVMKTEVLEKLNETQRKDVEKLMKFDAETAGGIMDLNFILVKGDFTVEDVAKKIHEHIQKENKAPLVACTDDEGTVLGFVPYKNLIVYPKHETIGKLVQEFPLVTHRTHEKRLISIATQTNPHAIGVVNEKKNLLGVIHANDLLKAGSQETTRAVFHLAGVHKEEDIYDPPLVSVRHRSRWLILNLLTAFLAASVVAMFQETIAGFVLIAAYLPVIAGEGGNAATQTLALVIRGIALKEVTWTSAKTVLLKEVATGAMNGILIGTLVSAIAMVLHSNPMFGLVVGTAMFTNLVVAGTFGALVPIILNKLNIDPAISSSIFITTATDVFGFLTLLGLASILL